MARRSKRYLEIQAKLNPDKAYTPEEALALIHETSTAKFSESVELHIRTGADARHADQLVRGVTTLPNGLGKQIRVVVFATGEAADIAKQSGADYVADEELIKRIEDGWADFEVGLAVPDVMSKIGKLGKVLGRRGLMPNPRTGTMVQPQDIPRAIQEAKQGRLEYKMDRTAIIHCSIGKSDFTEEQLMGNLATIAEAIVKARPAAVKGVFIKSVFLTTTMGPSIRLDLPSFIALKPA